MSKITVTFKDGRKETINVDWVTCIDQLPWATRLPLVLYAPKNNSLSMLRSLKQIKELLELSQAAWPCGQQYDEFEASLDDIETMLETLK
jgi:hypothetical protein